MVRHVESPYIRMISPSDDADRGLSKCWLSDAGSQSGGSEGSRSSGRGSCSHGAAGVFRGRRGHPRRRERVSGLIAHV